jgi:predicted nucleic acid-binding protein
METLSAVVDTSVLLRAENGDAQALDRLAQLVAGDALWGVAAISVYEVLCNGSAPSEWQEFFRELFSACEVLAITEDVALAAAAVNCTLPAPLKAPDALIAASAAAAGAMVITADEHFLRLPGLRVEVLRPC